MGTPAYKWTGYTASGLTFVKNIMEIIWVTVYLVMALGNDPILCCCFCMKVHSGLNDWEPNPELGALAYCRCTHEAHLWAHSTSQLPELAQHHLVLHCLATSRTARWWRCELVHGGRRHSGKGKDVESMERRHVNERELGSNSAVLDPNPCIRSLTTWQRGSWFSSSPRTAAESGRLIMGILFLPSSFLMMSH